jgi:uncharacterized protein (DUF2141 family)
MIKFVLASAAMMFLTAGNSCADPDATLTVTVQKVSPRGGDLRLALYDRAHWDDDDAPPVKDAVVPAITPRTVVTIPGLKPGTYGLKMFQDFNRNQNFDFTWLGLPGEKYGFSNDASAMFGEPSFDRARFTLLPGHNAMTVHLR